jgi:hypothetical protein
MEEHQAIERFLGDRPGSDQLREWRSTLEQRLKALEEERSRLADGPARALEPKIAQLRKQVAALSEEEAITQFVEDSVRVTLAMGAAAEGMDDIEE